MADPARIAEEPKWQAIKCHFCGTLEGPFPFKRGSGSAYACRPCGEREMLAPRKESNNG